MKQKIVGNRQNLPPAVEAEGSLQIQQHFNELIFSTAAVDAVMLL